MDKLQIAQVLSSSNGPRWDLRQAYVVSIGGGSATIRIGGSSTDITGVKYLGAAPTASAACWVMTNGLDLFILGQTS